MTDREKLIELLKAATDYSRVLRKLKCTTTEADEDPFIAMADHLIANGVVVREKGEWVKLPFRIGLPWKFRCNKCGCPQDYAHNFYPNCGADMRGRDNDAKSAD